MDKVKITMNLSRNVFEMLKSQAKEKGLDRGAYVTYLLHEQSKKDELQRKLEGLFFELLEKGDLK